jgi:hypothetical protein
MTRVAITTGASAGSLRRAATQYGPHAIEDVLPSRYETKHGEQVLEWTFSYDDLPTNGADQAILRIPANAFIHSATWTTLETFTGGTSYNVGLDEVDGTAIDVDGIDAAIAIADFNAVGETILMDGALVGGLTGIGTADGQLTVVATGTFTAGKARIRIVYSDVYDRA